MFFTEKTGTSQLDRLEKLFKSSPAIIALIYIIVGTAWILYSDQMVLSIFENTEALTRVQSYKGFFFVIASGVLIFILVKKSNDMLGDLIEQLSEARDKLESTFDHTPIGIAHIEPGSGLAHVNRELKTITGYADEDLNELEFNDLLNCEDPDELREMDSKLLEREMDQYQLTQKFRRKDGSSYTGDLTKAAVYDQSGELLYVIAVLQNISKAIKNREELKRSLQQKELLLSEVHHRVRNNLALMSAMLELELMHTDRQQLSRILIAYKTRLKSISLVYDYYAEKNGELIVQFDKCVHSLVSFMEEIFENREHGLQYRCELENIRLDINQSIPAMLVYNEVLMHINDPSAPNSNSGELSVLLKEFEDEVRFEVNVNRKIPGDSELYQTESLNYKLLKSFIDQLHGDLEIESTGGFTQLEVTFEKNSELGSANHMETLEL